MAKEFEPKDDLFLNHPSAWDAGQFRSNWSIFLEALLKEEASSLIPSRRIRRQIEQTSAFQEAFSGWDKMGEPHRLDAWKRLLLAADEACRTVLPASSAANVAGWEVRSFTWRTCRCFSPAKFRGNRS